MAAVLRKKYWISDISLTQDAKVEIPLPEDHGLIQVSVFDENQQLLYDKLIASRSAPKMIKIVANKMQYGKREKVEVNIIKEDQASLSGNLDLSVSVSQKLLEGNIYYRRMDDYLAFENHMPVVLFKVDEIDTNALLCDHRSNPVDWKEINKQLAFGRERYYNRDGLTGVVYDKKKAPVGYAKVKAINLANWKSYETQCDESGVFRVLFGSDIIDFNYMNINAFDASGKNILWPGVDQDFSRSVNKNVWLREQDIAQQKVIDLLKFPLYDLSESFQYQEKKRKNIEKEQKKINSPQQYVSYSNVMDIIFNLKQLDIVNDQIYFKGNQSGYSGVPGALIMVDGVPQGTHISVINNLTPPEIVYINIHTSPSDIKRYTSINYSALIEIITVRGIALNRMLPGISGLDMLELNREFHSPDYANNQLLKRDDRTTLYWNPEIELLQHEYQSHFSFYTSDNPGVYTITVQGFDESGNPVSAQAEIVVKE